MGNKVLFIFFDGLGTGEPKEKNPFFYHTLPYFESLIEGKPVLDREFYRDDTVFKGIDATLNVEGMPQSATGQTSLFTGVNGAQHLGYHLPAFPDENLKAIIDEHTILKRVVDAGKTATFANAYTSGYFEMVKRGERKHSVTTLSVYAAGIPFRFAEDLKKGEAVYWDMTNEFMVSMNKIDVPIISPEQAGKNLAGLSRSHDLVIYECFLPDLIGHKKNRDKAHDFINRMDGFLKGVMENQESNTTTIIASDHGNMEDLEYGGHTTNPSIFLAKGNRAVEFKAIKSILDIADIIYGIITGDSGG